MSFGFRTIFDVADQVTIFTAPKQAQIALGDDEDMVMFSGKTESSTFTVMCPISKEGECHNTSVEWESLHFHHGESIDPSICSRLLLESLEDEDGYPILDENGDSITLNVLEQRAEQILQDYKQETGYF